MKHGFLSNTDNKTSSKNLTEEKFINLMKCLAEEKYIHACEIFEYDDSDAARCNKKMNKIELDFWTKQIS